MTTFESIELAVELAGVEEVEELKPDVHVEEGGLAQRFFPDMFQLLGVYTINQILPIQQTQTFVWVG